LGLARPRYRVITVAGTNGKGSTVAYLDAVLRACGHRTGSLTSPHLLRYNERVRVEGRQAADAELVEVFERIERARGRTTLTFFEYNALAALQLFADRQVEVAVLEVGLGGRLDATNIVDADVGVVCSVGLDHRDWLGDTLDAIGAEKAGIFRAGRPAVLGSADMPATVFGTIERLHARPVVAGREFDFRMTGETWTYRGLAATLPDLPAPALAGGIQFRNAATALAAYECLPGLNPLRREAVAEALRATRLPGRFQILEVPSASVGAVPGGTVEWILDVAHNEPAAQVLASHLRARPVAGKTYAVASILRDKDAPAIGRALASSIDEWIVCGLPGPRGSSASEVAERLAEVMHAPLLADDVSDACQLASARARPGDRIVVLGSFGTVGSALRWLGYTEVG
ncbi:MAG: bifunctional folylpolyglutamate synthase/dihydrofolate synthase, partial [Steroidobacteraceae bacterium]